jgi:hypothetical protein
MELLACTGCKRRFYVPGNAAPEGKHCSQCGADLVVSLHGIRSIPLDARGLGVRSGPRPRVTTEAGRNHHPWGAFA